MNLIDTLANKAANIATQVLSLVKSHYATLKAAIGYIYNKLPAIVLLWWMTHKYLELIHTTKYTENGLPFIELLYGAIILGTIAVGGPFMRLMIWPEVAKYAEGGQLTTDLYGAKSLTSVTPALLHYWIITGICNAVPAIVMAGAMHLGK